MKLLIKVSCVLLGLASYQVQAMSLAETTALQELQSGWAKIKYTQVNKDKQKSSIQQLSKRSQQIVSEYANSAELKVWNAIILSTQAGMEGGLGALDLVKQARDQLLAAEKINPTALNGSVYTSLGSLYYQVPGWPIGFGDHDKARTYLEKAIRLNPNGIDANFFYGDFLIEEKQYKQAITALEKAKSAPARQNRPLADKGRNQEIDLAIKKAKDGIITADDFF